MNTSPIQQRLLSLDFMRGLIMILLMLESTRLFEHIDEISKGTSFHFFTAQFFHHPWNGLHFWDLIQPAFMFMAGVAMVYSLNKQIQNNIPWNRSFLKVLKRSGWLFFFGVLDYAVRPTGLSFELWDVLTQLSFTTLVAFLIFRWPAMAQIIFSIGLLVLTEILYRFSNIPGFSQPFTDQHNFGNYVDILLMNKINADGWVAINCLPTAAHTIWGSVVGKFLLSAIPNRQKIRWLVIPGSIGLMVGYSMNYTITPMIKRLATSSFVLASGGWCILALTLCYWWIDVKQHKQHLQFFIVVGVNSLFIYLFIEIVGNRWFNDYVGAITDGLMTVIHVPFNLMVIITSLTMFFIEWKICQFLYHKNIFFKI